MRVLHRSKGTARIVAEDVDRADSWFSKGRGLMFRRSIPDDYALVFEFGDVAVRRLHMVCVPFPIDAVWLSAGRVEHTKRLSAWIGRGAAQADTVIEFPAGTASEIEVGDRLVVESRES